MSVVKLNRFQVTYLIIKHCECLSKRVETFNIFVTCLSIYKNHYLAPINSYIRFAIAHNETCGLQQSIRIPSFSIDAGVSPFGKFLIHHSTYLDKTDRHICDDPLSFYLETIYIGAFFFITLFRILALYYLELLKSFP